MHSFCMIFEKIFLHILLHTESVIHHGIFGNELRTASENRLWGISCSNNITSFSVVLSPISPNARTK